MLIDCDTCQARDIACDDCVVTVLLGTPQVPASGETYAPVLPTSAPEERQELSGALELDAQERAALQVLADFGLIPPLRLARDVQPAAGHEDRHAV